jgi:hypothetical protein
MCFVGKPWNFTSTRVPHYLKSKKKAMCDKKDFFFPNHVQIQDGWGFSPNVKMWYSD